MDRPIPLSFPIAVKITPLYSLRPMTLSHPTTWAAVTLSAVASLGCNVTTSNPGAPASQPSSAKGTAAPATDNTALPPGIYCYSGTGNLDGADLDGVVRLQIEAGGRVTGVVSVTADNAAAGTVFTANETLTGQLTGTTLTASFIERAGGEEFQSDDEWTMDQDQIVSRTLTYNSADCAVVESRLPEDFRDDAQSNSWTTPSTST